MFKMPVVTKETLEKHTEINKARGVYASQAAFLEGVKENPYIHTLIVAARYSGQDSVADLLGAVYDVIKLQGQLDDEAVAAKKAKKKASRVQLIKKSRTKENQ